MEKQPSAREADSKQFPDGFRIMQGRQEFITYIEHSSIRIWPSDQAGHYDSHMHSAVEVILPDSGVSVYKLQDQEYHVEPGQILFIPSGCPHELTESAEVRRYLILFEPSPLFTLRDMPDIREITDKPIYLSEDSEQRMQIHDLMKQVIDCYFQHEPMWNTRCYAYLMQVYALLGQSYLRIPKDVPAEKRRIINPEIMNSALTYINEHFTEDISLESVASFAGFSKYYFSRLFREFSGITFSEYLLDKRVNHAANLLIQTKNAIHTIAESSGFSSIATFNRIFRDQKKCTPTQYRVIYSGMMNHGVLPQNMETVEPEQSRFAESE